ncbi:DUF3037 domain-containing protein [Sphingobium sp. CECT 9361]|uniref:DUF3037 domain-containing protein n=1 Tax=Sphingobium sp. CECT 9361 TaxID=2845384 RepID=UPI001E31524F|nr:DUF3037 domain-containing protein [Sphingobium sp. CECT 9361]CAH0355342.1 hypothetical protein SPH9361_03419 [Sphingobium sp. CECT 9361]
MKEVYRYSIIRFQPFADLGEFANVGVVAISPSHGAAAFKIARKRFGRLHDFFGDDAYRAYGPAVDYLREELGRLVMYGGLGASREAIQIFNHLTREHESTLVFSEVRTVLFEAGIDELVRSLFARLVMRQLQEANDLTLITEIRQALRENGIRSFKAIRLDDDVVPVKFPIANDDGRLRAIHPLAFNQKTPLAVFDHGSLWRKRLSYLLNQNKIDEGAVLLAVEPPENGASRSIQHAFNEAMGEIQSLPFEQVEGQIHGQVNPRIIQFADAVISRRSPLFN